MPRFALFFGFALALGVGACSLTTALDSLHAGGTTDAGSDASDAGPEASGVCESTAPFTNVRGLSVNTAENEYAPSLSPDELEIWFGRGDDRLAHANRASRAADFGTVEISALSDDAGASDPALAADAKTLYYLRHGLAGSWDIYRATRPSPVGDFGGSMPLSIATTAAEVMPFPTADGKTLYFVRSDANGADIWSATSTGTDFASATKVAELSSPADDFGAALSKDELTVYVASDRTDLGPKGQWDVYRATRAKKSDPWGPLASVPELDTAFSERVTWISPDGCRVYFDTTRTNGAGLGDVYVAERFPK